jgi:hypothetical protein
MSRTWDPRAVSPTRIPKHARPGALAGLVFLLAATGTGLATVAGLPDPGRLLPQTADTARNGRSRDNVEEQHGPGAVAETAPPVAPWSARGPTSCTSSIVLTSVSAVSGDAGSGSASARSGRVRTRSRRPAGLYQGDLLERVAVPTYPWRYDKAALATSLRPEYRQVQEEVRLRLTDLYAAGSAEQELGRAAELYTELTAERPEDDRLWVSAAAGPGEAR